MYAAHSGMNTNVLVFSLLCTDILSRNHVFVFCPLRTYRLIIKHFPLKPVASILGIPPENIFANQLLFKSSGEFLGFDANEPTSRSGGKATAVQQIRKVGLILIPV